MKKARRDSSDQKEVVWSQPPTDETTFDSKTLTLDLVEDILCRLPVKLLMQLRCVCKCWNSLISDPIFAKKHLRRSQTLFNRRHLIMSRISGAEFQLWYTPLPSFFNSMSTNVPSTRLSLSFQISDYSNVIGSCDGILCFSIGKYNNSLMAWNPFIRKFKILPPLKNQPELIPELKGVYGKTIYGFGYDRLTDTYKVVAFYCYEVGSIFNWVCKKIQIHTLGTDTWKTILTLPSAFPFGRTLGKYGIFLSGTVNWMELTSNNLTSVIFSFDLENESYQELLPPDDGVDVCTMRLGVLRDSLSIFSHTWTSVIHVWLMEDYGNKDSWTKLFVVPYGEFFDGPDRFPACPLYILEDDQLLLDSTRKLAVYNSSDRTGKILKIESISDGSYLDSRHVYIESLISP